MLYGAKIERGTVTGKSGGGYTVKSLDRDGIETLGCRAMHEQEVEVKYSDSTVKFTVKPEYETGDTVYFAVMGDGNGIILEKVSGPVKVKAEADQTRK